MAIFNSYVKLPEGKTARFPRLLRVSKMRCAGTPNDFSPELISQSKLPGRWTQGTPGKVSPTIIKVGLPWFTRQKIIILNESQMVFLMWDHHWWLSPSEIRGVIRFNHQQPWIEGRISTISAGYPTDGSKKGKASGTLTLRIWDRLRLRIKPNDILNVCIYIIYYI